MKMFVAPTALALFGLSGFTSAAYTLTDNLVASNFFGAFNFMTGNDPTHGFVDYIDQGTAQNQGLINTNNNRVYMGVDYKTNNPGGRGRKSVRLESKKQYTHGLFILDLNHMPGSICGVWPAFWTYGPNWPNSGEIDILEGVNTQSVNWVSLHTGGVCKAQSGPFEGALTSTDCAVSTGGGAGCSIHSRNGASYGTGLNNVGGGVYVMEWLSSGIKVWFFARNAGIPGDISSGNPNPSSWGTPMASFPSGSNCNIDSNFANHWVTFDTTFCGDWAGSPDVWNNDPTCRSKASSCQAYVAGNPGAFQQAYWDINSLKIYRSDGISNVNSSPASSSTVKQPVASPIVSSTTLSASLVPTSLSTTRTSMMVVTTSKAQTSQLTTTIPAQSSSTSAAIATSNQAQPTLATTSTSSSTSTTSSFALNPTIPTSRTSRIVVAAVVNPTTAAAAGQNAGNGSNNGMWRGYHDRNRHNGRRSDNIEFDDDNGTDTADTHHHHHVMLQKRHARDHRARARHGRKTF